LFVKKFTHSFEALSDVYLPNVRWYINETLQLLITTFIIFYPSEKGFNILISNTSLTNKKQTKHTRCYTYMYIYK